MNEHQIEYIVFQTSGTANSRDFMNITPSYPDNYIHYTNTEYNAGISANLYYVY